AKRRWRSRIGAVLQVSTQSDELTVGEIVQAFGAYYPNPLEVEPLLDALDLTAQRDRKVFQLSGGQRRRLDIALGLVGDPELVFLDEPTTGLDPEVRIRIWEFVKTLSEGGTTILLTTHYMEEAEKLADQVAVLVSGKVIAQGSPRQLTGAQQSRVSFRLSGPAATASLPEGVPGLITRDGDLIEVTTTNPTDTVTRFVGWATERGGSLTDLNVEKHGLEQVYLDLLTNTREETSL
ncbi:MAG: ABC transporter ATP-binding protein, partial [Acidimicrobiia bacterium]|nr:ABC transporter ATP-binding protein [Acidimicrobiia bacterium]